MRFTANSDMLFHDLRKPCGRRLGRRTDMDFITAADITDTILTCRDCDIQYANDYLHRLAFSFSLSDSDIQLPARPVVKQLGCAVACRECAAAMVGSDTGYVKNFV